MLPPRNALAVVAFALLMCLSWQLGRLSARESAIASLDGAVNAWERASGAGVASGTLERLTAERDVALAAAARLESRLGEAGRVAGNDAAELALYRRIESGDGIDGLSVESIAIVDAGTPDAALAITLVQSRGRDRVTGTLGARVLHGAGEGTPVGEVPVEFDLRFFQTVRLPLGAAAASLEAGASSVREDGSLRIELDVRPTGDRHSRFVEILPLAPIVAE